MLGYFLKVRPFENSVLNFLQVYNELVVISAICHMFVFSEGIQTSSPMRVNAGWTFDLIIALQIVVNLVCLGGVTSHQVYRLMRQKVRVYLHKRRVQSEKKVERNILSRKRVVLSRSEVSNSIFEESEVMRRSNLSIENLQRLEVTEEDVTVHRVKVQNEAHSTFERKYGLDLLKQRDDFLRRLRGESPLR